MNPCSVGVTVPVLQMGTQGPHSNTRWIQSPALRIQVRATWGRAVWMGPPRALLGFLSIDVKVADCTRLAFSEHLL